MSCYYGMQYDEIPKVQVCNTQKHAHSHTYTDYAGSQSQSCLLSQLTEESESHS